MTQEQHTEGTEAQDESMEDSPVMKALRKQIKDLQNQVKDAPSRDSIEAEVREQLARESAISTQLIELGHPAGLAEFLKGKLGDAEVSRESVAEALQGIGYKVEEADATAGSDGTDAASQSDLAKVTTLSAQVRSAAAGGTSDLMQKISQAKSPAELEAIMNEAGALDALH